MSEGVSSRGTVVIESERCKGCELCIPACPPRVPWPGGNARARSRVAVPSLYVQRPLRSLAMLSVTVACASLSATSGVADPFTILFIAVVTGDHISVISA